MNSTERVLATTWKAALLSSSLFWLLILMNEGMGIDFYLGILISTLLSFILCFIAIMATVMPFYLLEEMKLSSTNIFKKYFPYYAIIIFSLCMYFVIIEDFENFIIIFCTTTFITAIQSWIWFFKAPIIKTRATNKQL